MKNESVLILGAGVAGMEASLLLAAAGRKVHLVEKEPMIGGQLIKFEEVYPHMECSTCMVAPQQQAVLQNGNIEIHYLSALEKLEGSAGAFKASVKKKARYVSLANCIGCGACYDPCPVSLENEFEEGLAAARKAIAVPCAGALPNVPAIDPRHCLFLNGKDTQCRACKDACVFDAVQFEDKDETAVLDVGAVVVATGFGLLDVKQNPQYGYGEGKNVYTALEFERLFASNGPTGGNLTLRNGQTPKTVGIVHCVGRSELGYCSGVCCMYSVKFSRFLKHKLPDVRIREFHTDLCVPGKAYQKFFEKTRSEGVEFVRAETVKIASKESRLQVLYQNGGRGEEVFEADMVILSPAMIPAAGAKELAEVLGIKLDAKGFFAGRPGSLSPVETPVEGIFVIGCAEGPKDIPESVAQAAAAVGKILSLIPHEAN
ncbi:MAG: CoB--CoM heterodisulfide reductase iron-sulfur subunit A family protein [Candidatus Aminicenantes bacterium]|nr:CoB--CoM heterodisulfide reductase iron-sulfur subunit A family protein [Candidatus Aminicenantes bacterium]